MSAAERRARAAGDKRLLFRVRVEKLELQIVQLLLGHGRAQTRRLQAADPVVLLNDLGEAASDLKTRTG